MGALPDSPDSPDSLLSPNPVHGLQLGTPLPHAPGVRMTVVQQTPSKYIYIYIYKHISSPELLSRPINDKKRRRKIVKLTSQRGEGGRRAEGQGRREEARGRSEEGGVYESLLVCESNLHW